MNKVTDILIQQCKEGNRAAQKQLYYLSKDRLKYISLRYCKVIEDAQDAVQNAYLKIFRSINNFDAQKGNFKTWSNKILVNEIFMVLRKSKNIQFQNIESSPIHVLGINEMNLDKLTIQELRTTLDYLKDDQRLVLNMHYFEEYSYKEMAVILDIKESSVRSKVSRAKNELKLIWSKLNSVNYEV